MKTKKSQTKKARRQERRARVRVRERLKMREAAARNPKCAACPAS